MEKGASNKTRQCCSRPHFGGVAPGLCWLQKERRSGAGRAKYAALRVSQPQLGRAEAPAASRPRFPSWKKTLQCSSPPPSHGITAESGILYIYISATEGTINIHGTKARCSFLLSLPCLAYFSSLFLSLLFSLIILFYELFSHLPEN